MNKKDIIKETVDKLIRLTREDEIKWKQHLEMCEFDKKYTYGDFTFKKSLSELSIRHKDYVIIKSNDNTNLFELFRVITIQKKKESDLKEVNQLKELELFINTPVES